MKINKAIISILLLSLTGCTEFELPVKRKAPINISEVEVLTAGQINQPIRIWLTAEAPSGCWKNLVIITHKIDDFHFLFTAEGVYKSHGLCPDIIINKDSVVTIIPSVSGSYFFQTNESPFQIKRDSVVIN